MFRFVLTALSLIGMVGLTQLDLSAAECMQSPQHNDNIRVFHKQRPTATRANLASEAGPDLPLDAGPGLAEEAGQRLAQATRADYSHKLDPKTFAAFAAEAPGVRAVKVIVDRKPVGEANAFPEVYYIDNRVYDLHITFVRQNRLVSKSQLSNVQLETWRSEERRFIFAQLARYDSKVEESPFVVELFDEDRASAAIIAELMILLKNSSSLGEIYFKPNSLAQDGHREALEKLGVKVLANDALNENRLFQVVNAGKPAVGKLRVITETDPAKVERMIFNRNEIVVLRTIPNDITRIAGIITTRPTTPLSHVSLRARTWNIPNIMLRTALTTVYKEGLEDAWVHLEVGGDGRPILRRAKPEEVQLAEKARAESIPLFRIPRADLKSTKLVDLYDLRAEDVVRVGAKAANLGELASLAQSLAHEDLAPVLKATTDGWIPQALDISLPINVDRLSKKKRARLFMSKLNVPPGFGIPFSAYQAFLDYPPNANIQVEITKLLKDPQLPQDAVYRKQQLDKLQETIRAGQFPPKLGKRILGLIHKRLPDRRLFIRSSTNCEDLEDFNGAGLYETVGNVEGDKAILEAIKRVWASVWNFKAYEARTDAGIRHDAVYPGILVQLAARPYAAGVLITKDVLDRNGGNRYYLNANPGFGENTVNTGRGLPEQIYGSPESGKALRISLSERGGDLLTDNEVRQLVFFAAVVERHFGRLAGKFPYPQDIEWLIADGQISLVQTRPYIEP